MMNEYILFAACLVGFFTMNMIILKSSRLDEFFKKGEVFQNRLAYIIISLSFAYILTSIVLKLYDWIIVIIQRF